MDQLDGLRAIAVMAVFVQHWLSSRYHFGIPWGHLGVQLFFVISGFLITGILLDCREYASAPARTQVALRFYARRALRIFPAFYLTVALAWLAGTSAIRESFGWHVTYLSNAYFFLRGSWHGEVSHFWSLAVEEQFYLAWPWLVLFLSRRWIGVILVGCLVVAPAIRVFGFLSGQPFLFGVLPFASLDTLGMGALLAALVRNARARNHIETMSRVGLVVGVAGVVVTRLASGVVPVALMLEQSFLAMIYAWIVFSASRKFTGITGSVLELSGLRALGRISYGLYLWHNFMPLAFACVAATLGLPTFLLSGFPRIVILLAMTIGIASASWFLFERPINRLKRYVPYAPADTPMQKASETLSPAQNARPKADLARSAANSSS